MIDTIRFRIPISKETYELVRKSSSEFHMHNNPLKRIDYTVIKGDAKLGSYNRKVNIILYDEDSIYLELSLPKYVFGHNVFLLSVSQFSKVIDMLYTNLVDKFGQWPETSEWEIMRIDLCYAWKFVIEKEAEKILSILRSYNYPKKRQSFYDTSIMSVGSTYSVKFYLKKPEYKTHDFKALSEQYLEYAYDILDYSENILRFEVTLRKPAIKSLFKSRILQTSDITEENVNRILLYILKKFLGESTPISMTSTEAYQTLKGKYTEQKAIRLWQFYRVYRSEEKEEQQIIKNTYNRSTIYRNLRDIKLAGVGLHTQNKPMEFDLSIPSKYEVNSGLCDSTVVEHKRG